MAYAINSVIGRVRCKRITHSPFTSALRVLCPDAEFEFLYTTFVDFATLLFAFGLKLELLSLWRPRKCCLRFRMDRSIEVLQPISRRCHCLETSVFVNGPSLRPQQETMQSDVIGNIRSKPISVYFFDSTDVSYALRAPLRHLFCFR